MAETKTTIPVEIKMGNAGTNDANLPAFKEGSIIFTKDTKKIYIDPVGETERIAVGGEVDLSGKQDTITDSTNLTVNNLIVSSVLSLGKNDSENPISIQGLVTNSKPIISISSASGEYPRISGVGTPTADNDAVNRGYLTTKYGSTYYDSTAKEFYLPGGTNLVIPNSQAGRLYIGSESSTSADFKIYVNDPLDDGKLIITNLKIPTNDEDAANKKYVDTKQDKLDYSTSLMINSISLGNYTSQPSTTLNGYNIAFFDKGTTDEPKIVISPNVDKGAEDPKLTFSSVSVAGYDVVLSGVADPIGDTDVVNKKYLIDYIDTNAQEKIWSDVQLPSISEGTVSLGLLIGNKIAFSDDSYENDIIISGIKNGVADNDAVNVSQFNTKQDKFATYVEIPVSESAPAGSSYNTLTLNSGISFTLQNKATNPDIKFVFDDNGALQGTTTYLSLEGKNNVSISSSVLNFSDSESNGGDFQIVSDDSKKTIYYALRGGDGNGSIYLTNTSRTAQQGASIEGNILNDSQTTVLNVNAYSTKLLSWKQGTTTNHAPLLGVATPVAAADTDKGITAEDLDYQAVNKKYVDDAIGNIVQLFASLVDMTKTTTQSDEPSDDTEIINEPTDNEEETVNG